MIPLMRLTAGELLRFAPMRLLLALPLALFLSASVTLAEETISFDKHVRPIFAQHCLVCHGGLKQAGNLSMVWKETLLGESDSGQVVVPGDAEGSLLIDYVSEPDDAFRMPPAEHGPRLTTEEVDTLRQWINQGAHWELPWAFRKPTKPELPKLPSQETAEAEQTQNDNWPRKPMDHFVLARLQQEGLTPSPAASRIAWLRRVSFALTGLPPTPEETEAYQQDQEPEADERVVDRLLTSPHFGERWASVWLDLARYADTTGYEKDTHRNIWPYRDWVIRAFDDDKPYDDFLTEQLAGDLLPNATLENHVATAFHRNTPTNLEGGTDDEEFRIAAVLDRVNTTWQAVQGISFQCARCHDHTYDPITQEDYYRFFATLNSTQDIDVDEEFPRIAVPNAPADKAIATQLDLQLSGIQKAIHEQGYQLATQQAQWQGLTFDEVKSTEQTKLILKSVEQEQSAYATPGNEVVATGTISDRSYYELSAPAPLGKLTALRIDALPKDLAESIRAPEIGFVLSRLQLFVQRADGREEEIYFHSAFCNDPTPFYSPEDSLSDSTEGWAAYSRIFQPHWAVFVINEQPNGPLTLAAGDRLKVALKHKKTLDGQGALVIQRLRIATTDNVAWKDLREDKQLGQLRLDAHDLQTRRKKLASSTIPVMAELPAGRERHSYLFERGNFLNKGKQVTPGLPKVFDERPEEQENSSAVPARLQMAQWIASDKNPLTARVWVNRVWSELFGQGIVTTLDDFGTIGEKPSHPELFDYLAVQFMQTQHWQLKPLLRELVLSSTYRQSAKRSEAIRKQDPHNRWLSHGPRNRLSAEMIRDQALRLSGRFNSQRYGPPVMPYQPEGVWQSVANNQHWINSADNARFRRAIYIYWKRTAAYPSLRTFDAPSREVCAARRPTTNTPLQALVLLNDPAYHELAKEFAQQILVHGGDTLALQMAWAYQQATSQPASEQVVEQLVQLYHKQQPLNSEADTQEETKDQQISSLAIVASALLNLDATLCN